MLQWRSGFEARNLGYNLYREQNGKRTQITASLVAGSALIARRDSVMTAGQGYVWYDQVGQEPDGRRQTAGNGGVTYWLEDVDLNGTRTLHGPIAPSTAVSMPRGGMRSATLGEVSQRTLATGVLFSGGPTTDGRRQTAGGRGQKAVVRTQATLTAQQGIAATPGVKFAISKNGWYRVTQPELVAAGLAVNATGAQLQLFANAQEVPIKVSGDGGPLTASDYIEFFGQGLNSTTDTGQTYYLIAGGSAGQRIANLVDNNPLAPPSGPTGFAYTVERKERMIYFSGLLNGDAENFFGQIVSTSPIAETVPATHLDPTGGAAQLEVALQGVTAGSHTAHVLFNGTDIGTVSFANTDHTVQTLSVPAAALLSGDNSVQLTALGGVDDVSLVDSLRLTYTHTYAAENDALSIGVNDATQNGSTALPTRMSEWWTSPTRRTSRS